MEELIGKRPFKEEKILHITEVAEETTEVVEPAATDTVVTDTPVEKPEN